MESETLVTSSTPLLDDAYAYGLVEHPFPLNCFIRDWQLGSEFYQAVKIGVVQYVCTLASYVNYFYCSFTSLTNTFCYYLYR